MNGNRLSRLKNVALCLRRYVSSVSNGKNSESAKALDAVAGKEVETIKDDDEDSDYDEGASLPVPNPKYPIRRAYRILREDFRNIRKGRFFIPESEYFPTYVDVAIIGGGIMGSAIAFWLKHRAADGLKIVVIEKDPTFTRSSTGLAVGGLQQQFSLPENIKMAMFGAEFLRDIKKYLTVFDQDPPDVHFTPYGHLFLAKESEVDDLKENFKLQKEFGAQVELLSKTRLQSRFPWLNMDGVEMACCGYGSEGWFDPEMLLKAYQQKAVSLGVRFLNAEVTGFTFEKVFGIKVIDDGERAYERLSQIKVKTETGATRAINSAYIIVAAGSDSGQIGNLARIGTYEGILSQPIPVEPRKRYVYMFHCFDGPGLDCPHVIDPSGLHFRREGFGGNYICSKPPLPTEEPDSTHLDVDYSYFENSIVPRLNHRVPSFGPLKLKSAWAGYYDYNTFDQAGIVGPHPYYPNLLIAAGFNGLGVQQSPAIGRAVTELIVDGEFKAIDLTKLSFERFITNEPICEKNII